MSKQQNNIYWEKRIENALKRAPTNKVKKLYKDAYYNIEKCLIDLWIELSQKDEISLSSLYQCNRYVDLQNIIQNELQHLGHSQIQTTQTSLVDTYISAWNDMNNFSGASLEWTVINKVAAQQIIKENYKGATFSDRIWNDMQKLREQIENTITNTVVTGQDVRKAAKELQTRMNRGYGDAKRITITETARVHNEACRQQAIEAGFYKTYHILQEPDCCDECREYKGKHFDLNKSILPVHPHCKCCMIIDLL